MDFSLTDEQTMLADSVKRFIDTDYLFDERQRIVASSDGFCRDKWRTFVELGWTAVPFAESDGGLAGGPIELMLMMEQFGRGLVVEPYLANIVLAGGVLKRAASSAQKETWLQPLIGGDMQAAFAFVEPHSRNDIVNINTSAQATDGGYQLNGHKSYVLNGDIADLIIVPARTSGESPDESGISLFCVPGDSVGITRTDYPTIDGFRAAEMAFSDVMVAEDSILGNKDKAMTVIDQVLQDGILAVSAEALGIMQTMHDKTVEYSKSRVQFGVPIGSFQALQHRMVDSLMACEQTRSLLYWCVMLMSSGDNESTRAASALKHQIGSAGIKVAEEAVQLHGGMGMTWELDIAHYFKRMTAINIMFGNADSHLDKFAAYEKIDT